MHFVGSYGYNSGGSVTLGVAEGGMKITLYNVNNIDYENPDIEFLNYWFFKTMHHEFAHILHQTKPYPVEFNQVSAANYQSESWVNLEDDEWLQLGFITDYASRETQEDFVEIIANYITHDQAWWDSELAKATEEGRTAIETKLEIVRDWLKTSWEIDLDKLREIVQRRSANVPLLDLQTLD
jgi:substrate import-associated zinc metallohydrolase lipoprotein